MPKPAAPNWLTAVITANRASTSVVVEVVIIATAGACDIFCVVVLALTALKAIPPMLVKDDTLYHTNHIPELEELKIEHVIFAYRK
jgi:hypothetical protein